MLETIAEDHLTVVCCQLTCVSCPDFNFTVLSNINVRVPIGSTCELKHKAALFNKGKHIVLQPVLADVEYRAEFALVPD